MKKIRPIWCFLPKSLTKKSTVNKEHNQGSDLKTIQTYIMLNFSPHYQKQLSDFSQNQSHVQLCIIPQHTK